MGEFKRLERDLVHKGKIIDVYQDKMLTPSGDTVMYDIVEHKGAASMVAVEDTKTCAMRELEEETGYRPEYAEHLLDVFTSVGFCNEKIYIYYTDSLIPSKQNLDADEYVNVERYTLEELVELIKQGKIEDSKSVAGILTYKSKMGL